MTGLVQTMTFLAKLSLEDPRKAARTLLALDIPVPARTLGLMLMAVASATIAHLNLMLLPALLLAALKMLLRVALQVAFVAVLAFAMIFVIYGWEFTSTAFYRISELAELPLWLIHMAWPIAGVTWLVFAGERMWDDVQILLHGEG